MFRDYAELDVKMLEGYTITNVFTGNDARKQGFVMELEKVFDNVTFGIDVVFNPVPEKGDTQFMISQQYVVQK